MTINILKKLAWSGFFASTVFMYQNCGQGFSAAELESFSATSLSSHAMHINPATQTTEANTDLEFNVYSDEVLSSASYTWSHTLDGMVSACTVKNNSTSTNYILNCPRTGKLAVSLAVSKGNDRIVLPGYQMILKETPPEPNEDISLAVNFEIKEGTGDGAWNTTSTVVETFVGQTLTIKNLDSKPKQVHTNGAPCPHGATSFTTGNSTTCVINSAYDYRKGVSVYNHLVGPNAAFYLIAHDGAALYQQNCASCHGALASSTKLNSAVRDIKNGIATIPNMKTQNLMNLTQKQLEAISYALTKK